MGQVTLVIFKPITNTDNHNHKQRTLIFLIVKLCVHFVSVCLKVQKWIQIDTKVTFHPTNQPENFFCCQMKGMAKIIFFLQYYGIDFAQLIGHFIFIRRRRLSLWKLSQLQGFVKGDEFCYRYCDFYFS